VFFVRKSRVINNARVSFDSQELIENGMQLHAVFLFLSRWYNLYLPLQNLKKFYSGGGIIVIARREYEIL
jgi:hypothetical protein